MASGTTQSYKSFISAVIRFIWYLWQVSERQLAQLWGTCGTFPWGMGEGGIPHKADSCRLFNSDFIKINKYK